MQTTNSSHNSQFLSHKKSVRQLSLAAFPQETVEDAPYDS